jgi:hypothetical protein
MKKIIEWLKGKWDSLNKHGKVFACAVAVIIAIAIIKGVIG